MNRKADKRGNRFGRGKGGSDDIETLYLKEGDVWDTEICAKRHVSQSIVGLFLDYLTGMRCAVRCVLIGRSDLFLEFVRMAFFLFLLAQ